MRLSTAVLDFVRGSLKDTFQDLILGYHFPMEMTSHFVTDEQIKQNYFYTNRTYNTVPVIRISEYINKYIATRRIPSGKKGAVVMKLDVEVTILLHVVLSLVY